MQTALEPKFAAIIDLLDSLRWTLGDLLYHMFRLKDEKNEDVKGRSRGHTDGLEKFVRGCLPRVLGASFKRGSILYIASYYELKPAKCTHLIYNTSSDGRARPRQKVL